MTGGINGNDRNGASSNVSAEWAAITPGIDAAAVTSTELSVPWAKDDRTKYACVRPSTAMSS